MQRFYGLEGYLSEDYAQSDPKGSSMSFIPERPFDSIESAQQFVKLFIEAIEECRRDMDADIAWVGGNPSESKKQALQLVSRNLARLSQHMTVSRRILNDLRSLRRLLLKERQSGKQSRITGGYPELKGLHQIEELWG